MDIQSVKLAWSVFLAELRVRIQPPLQGIIKDVKRTHMRCLIVDTEYRFQYVPFFLSLDTFIRYVYSSKILSILFLTAFAVKGQTLQYIHYSFRSLATSLELSTCFPVSFILMASRFSRISFCLGRMPLRNSSRISYLIQELDREFKSVQTCFLTCSCYRTMISALHINSISFRQLFWMSDWS